jgi:hypothetical protein
MPSCCVNEAFTHACGCSSNAWRRSRLSSTVNFSEREAGCRTPTTGGSSCRWWCLHAAAWNCCGAALRAVTGQSLAARALRGDRCRRPSRSPMTAAPGRRLAARTVERGPHLVYLPNHGRHGPAAARNLGWRVARAELIAFTDDDTVPPPTGWRRPGGASPRRQARARCAAGWCPRCPPRPSDYVRDAPAAIVGLCHRQLLLPQGGAGARRRLRRTLRQGLARG